MSQVSIFRWRSGIGWLVLSGGGDFRADEALDIDTFILTRTISHNPLAIIWAAGDVEQADHYLDYLDDLGGRTGYLVDIVTEDDQSITTQLSEAGIIILSDGMQVQRLQNALSGAAIAAIETAYANGATIYAQGQAAALFGTWINTPEKGLHHGLGWVENAIIAPTQTDEQMAVFQQMIQNNPDSYGVGLGIGSAIALNPEGAVEIWGQPRVKVLLGKNLSAS